ncbi:hypothetical protein [Spirosoma panaciterrae]|uniref:hypothetical protein n=1 Tax=Spirosoma panaciterrae TaxID=496058 RepID=UPI00036E63BE|nr:hypothetical protein [Spirosoma panaciterrae]
MEMYDLTLRFDDHQHTLTAEDGLPIDEVAKILASLSQALGLNKDQKVVLSDVRGNCYALNLSTNSITVHETLKVIHRKISQNDYQGLTTQERQYVATLKSVMRDEYTLDVYDNTKEFRVHVEKVNLPKTPQYYYDRSTVYGVITLIGGQTIDGATYINIGLQNYPIKVTAYQERQLIKYFKQNKILFTINRRIRYDNDAVVSAELETFEITGEALLLSIAEDLREANPDGIFIDMEDSVDAVRKLRD